MRRLLLILAALAVAVYVALPPSAVTLPARPPNLTEPVRGAIHAHTRRSDGSGSVEQVAQAAVRAGLRFIVVTDHGDGTRPPDAPEYHSGVLVIDAVEISTEGGHIVALGLPASPYPLAGEARDVVDDVHRMGGFAIAAHPSSQKPDLRWSDWSLPIDGLEHLNGDSEWRDESALSLMRAVLAYPVRPAETLATLFDRSEETFRHWDDLLKQRAVVAMPGADAHGRMGLRAQEPYKGRLALPVPGYEAVFRAASVALPRLRLTSDPAVDARSVLSEVTGGRLFSSIDALGRHPAFDFAATSGDLRAMAGESLGARDTVHLSAAVQAPADVQVVLFRDGAEVHTATGPVLRYDGDAAPAVYRAEVRWPHAPGNPPVPWIVSNPIYVNRASTAVPVASRRAPAVGKTDLYVDGPAPDWTVEHSSASQAALDVVNAVAGTQLLFRFAISGSAASHPFAALVAPAGPSLASHDRMTFTARANRPMRVSVQLRAPASDPAGERWYRSFYADNTPRQITVWFDEMTPRGPTSTSRPALQNIRSILFVIDTINTPAGTAGQLFLDDVRFER